MIEDPVEVPLLVPQARPTVSSPAPSPQNGFNSSVNGIVPNTAKILVVDDTPVNQKVVRNQLKLIGYVNVHCVDHGQMALDRLAQESFDVILMDCQMPVLDGYDTTRCIRQEYGDRPPPLLP